VFFTGAFYIFSLFLLLAVALPHPLAGAGAYIYPVDVKTLLRDVYGRYRYLFS
jgi:hypothetical protein